MKPLFSNAMILNVENPIESKTNKNTKNKLLELMSKFIKVTGYSLNIQKSVRLLHVNNE